MKAIGRYKLHALDAIDLDGPTLYHPSVLYLAQLIVLLVLLLLPLSLVLHTLPTVVYYVAP